MEKHQKKTKGCVYYVKNRKLVMNFIILWNVHFSNIKNINKAEEHTEPEYNKVKKNNDF
jgi:large-conductance mechanosensitive channel